MNTIQRLKKFAICRENAYRIENSMQTGKMKAISRIRQVADHFSDRDEAAQLRAVKQLENDILMIIPDHRSRYQKLRAEMMDLIQKTRDL